MSLRAATSHIPRHPGVSAHQRERARSVENRVADAITRFAGSMAFVYVHVAWFALWIGLGAEPFPYGLLTMMVSLEAIFLSTFILISQNRQDEARRQLADAEWQLEQEQARQNQLEVRQNEELLELSKQILELTRAMHGRGSSVDAADTTSEG